MHEGARQLAHHVRTVHLTLLVTCVAIMVATYLAQPMEFERANGQLRDAMLVMRRVSPQWYEEYLRDAGLGDDRKGVARNYLQGDILIDQKRYGLFISDPAGLKLPSDEWAVHSKLEKFAPFLRTQTVDYETLSLSSIRDCWNLLAELNTALQVRRVTRIAVYYYDAGSLVGRPEFPALANNKSSYGVELSPDQSRAVMRADNRLWLAALLDPVRFAGRLDTPRNSRFQSVVTATGGEARMRQLTLHSTQFVRTYLFEREISRRNRNEVCLEVGVETEQVAVRGPLLSLVAAAKVNTPIGRFEEIFPDLTDLTRTFQDAPVGQVRSILHTVAERTAGDFQVLGVKIPVRAVRGSGLAIILAIQLYFTLHIVQLARTPRALASDPWEAAWIGLYNSWFAHSVTILTVTVAPVLTNILIATRFDGRWHLPPLHVQLALYLSVTIAIFTGWRLSGLWRALGGRAG